MHLNYFLIYFIIDFITLKLLHYFNIHYLLFITIVFHPATKPRLISEKLINFHAKLIRKRKVLREKWFNSYDECLTFLFNIIVHTFCTSFVLKYFSHNTFHLIADALLDIKCFSSIINKFFPNEQLLRS